MLKAHTKRLRNQIQELKETLLNKEVTSYGWLSTKDMLADMTTKRDAHGGRHVGDTSEERVQVVSV